MKGWQSWFDEWRHGSGSEWLGLGLGYHSGADGNNLRFFDLDLRCFNKFQVSDRLWWIQRSWIRLETYLQGLRSINPIISDCWWHTWTVTTAGMTGTYELKRNMKAMRIKRLSASKYVNLKWMSKVPLFFSIGTYQRQWEIVTMRKLEVTTYRLTPERQIRLFIGSCTSNVVVIRSRSCLDNILMNQVQQHNFYITYINRLYKGSWSCLSEDLNRLRFIDREYIYYSMIAPSDNGCLTFRKFNILRASIFRRDSKGAYWRWTRKFIEVDTFV